MNTSRRDDGGSYVELVIVMALLATLAGLATPVTAQVIDAGRARQAAGFIAARFRMARQLAVVRTAAIGLVFDLIDGRWTFRVCQDGNRNGIRRADVGGVDACHEGPYDIEAMFPGVSIAVDGTLPGPEGDPASSDPVRFGRSNIASFSYSGSCTAGTLYLRSVRKNQYAVRVGNISGRTRLLKFDPGTRKWLPA